jgi:hypothetical protein
MGLKRPLTSGRWSQVTWQPPGLPDQDDVVYSDGKTIVVDLFDEDYRVKEITNNSDPDGVFAVRGGNFILVDNCILKADVTGGNSTCVLFNSAAPARATVIGKIQGPVAGGGNTQTFGILHNNTGTLFVSGSVFGGTNGTGIGLAGRCTAYINGSIYGSDIPNAGFGMTVFPITLLEINGDCVCRANNTGVRIFDGFPGGTTIINITGGIIGDNQFGFWDSSQAANTLSVSGYLQGGAGTFSHGFNGNNNPGCILNVKGVIRGGSGSQATGATIATGVLNLTGTVVGGPGNSAWGIQNNTGQVYVDGIASGNGIGANAAGIANQSFGYVFVKTVVGSDFGLTNPGSGRINPGVLNGSSGVFECEELRFGATGGAPVRGPVFIKPSPNNRVIIRGGPPNFTPTAFFTSTTVDDVFPQEKDVRKGTVYGLGDFTGTMAVPSPSAVQFEVPVDDTKGELFLKPDDFWNIPRSSLTDPSTIGYRLKNAATIASVGRIIGSLNVEELSGYNWPLTPL